MREIEWNIMIIPPEIVAVCEECRYELACVPYIEYSDREDTLKDLKKHLRICPKCKTRFVLGA